MAKKKKAGLIIAMVGVLAIGGICTGLAIWANKKEKDAESSAVDYSLEKDRQMIVGTYRSFEDLPVVLTLEIKGYTPERKDEKKSFASDADMTTQAGQNSNAVWTDLSSWVSTFLGEKESLTGFFGSGGTVLVVSSCHGGDVSSCPMQLTHSGVWFVGLPEKDGDAPTVTRADVVFQ